MDSEPLVREFIDAGAKFLAEYEKTVPVKAAFWLKDPERTKWDLYVASERFAEVVTSDDRSELTRVARALHDPHLDQIRIRLVPAAHPAVEAALKVRQQYPDAGPVRLLGRMFGKEYVDGVYIYPTATLATAT